MCHKKSMFKSDKRQWQLSNRDKQGTKARADKKW